MVRRSRGFTLVELLVVVSIIALLISILLPSLRRARDQAKQVVCASNLKQVSGALWSYWTEHSGRIPLIVSPMTNGGGSGEEGTVPGFGDAQSEDDEIDPFNRLEEADGDQPKGWPLSLPNVLMPCYIGQEERLFVCPAAIVGWPRLGGKFRMTYRPAAANQLNGAVPATLGPGGDGEDFNYIREHFAFMDGRMFKPPEPFKRSGDDRISVIRDALRAAAMRGTFLRDMVQWKLGELHGPHRRGNNVINKRLEIEYRTQEQINEDLAPSGQQGVEF